MTALGAEFYACEQTNLTYRLFLDKGKVYSDALGKTPKTTPQGLFTWNDEVFSISVPPGWVYQLDRSARDWLPNAPFASPHITGPCCTDPEGKRLFVVNSGWLY